MDCPTQFKSRKTRRGNILARLGRAQGKRGPGSPGKPCLECDLYQPLHIDFVEAMVEAMVGSMVEATMVEAMAIR